MTQPQIALACGACCAIGFIGGFAGGFRVAAMIFAGVQRVRGARLRVVAAHGQLLEVEP
jgi:hypothetical protein